MGRFLNAEILLMPANDYGSRAKNNADSIKTLLEKFGLSYQMVEAKKDSFKVEIEAAKKAEELAADMILISSSRDYGIDDIIFGPKELSVIKKSKVPVMIINPRKDLYTLCG
jgi:nucleotide-binding universal stress UspA family protein